MLYFSYVVYSITMLLNEWLYKIYRFCMEKKVGNDVRCTTFIHSPHTIISLIRKIVNYLLEYDNSRNYYSYGATDRRRQHLEKEEGGEVRSTRRLRRRKNIFFPLIRLWYIYLYIRFRVHCYTTTTTTVTREAKLVILICI